LTWQIKIKKGVGHCFLLSISNKVGYCFSDPDPEFVTTAPHFWVMCPMSEPAVELYCFEVVGLITDLGYRNPINMDPDLEQCQYSNV
jgi:hypothetical protein